MAYPPPLQRRKATPSAMVLHPRARPLRPFLLLSGLYAFAAPLEAQEPSIKSITPTVAYGIHPQAGNITLLNSARDTVELQGWALLVNGHVHRLRATDRIPPKHELVLYTAPSPRASLPWDLSANGGHVQLLAPGRSNPVDTLTWPQLPPGIAFERDPGTRTMVYRSTGNASNRYTQRMPPPDLRIADGKLLAGQGENRGLRVTLDGSKPDIGLPIAQLPIALPAEAVVRAISFESGALPSAESVRLPQDLASVRLLVGHADLYDPISGIHHRGQADNDTRDGPAWQRDAWLAMPGDLEGRPARIAIAGSGSRTLAKKNLEIHVPTDSKAIRLPDGTTWRNIILRADATPMALMRNRFVNRTITNSGNRMDPVEGPAEEVYLNGNYHGLFRILHPKNDAWTNTLADGRATEVTKAFGSTGETLRSLHLAISRSMPLDSLALFTDTGSLVESVVMDLWTGRPDHDHNTRIWRSRDADGKWRWIAYDFDLWSPPKDPSLMRMLESPGWPALAFGHPQLRRLVLQRFTELTATTLAPAEAQATTLELHNELAGMIDRDARHWRKAIGSPNAKATKRALFLHIKERNGILHQDLARYLNSTARTTEVRVEPPGSGTITLYNTAITQRQTRLLGFEGILLHLDVVPAPGMEFVEWQGLGSGPSDRSVEPGQVRSITAVLRPVAASGKNR